MTSPVRRRTIDLFGFRASRFNSGRPAPTTGTPQRARIKAQLLE